ncbi:hypothetical protein COB55_03190 [Candidatus Wolfebacteria bacterium]|nr:MAG: hypothetical protein COB55_03190 [Candidatus Wolfebacteria bacterium]
MATKAQMQLEIEELEEKIEEIEEKEFEQTSDLEEARDQAIAELESTKRYVKQVEDAAIVYEKQIEVYKSHEDKWKKDLDNYEKIVLSQSKRIYDLEIK